MDASRNISVYLTNASEHDSMGHNLSWQAGTTRAKEQFCFPTQAGQIFLIAQWHCEI